ncbi:MAG: hypothetical protein BWY44_00843 [Candidatus Omnitrophica bacterium ADurb.Bin292]|nr:MAG: hypothetical protein BWY44_00843 [Candidatus Omnitrophica bacterium ADurb.Bin292]HPW76535.1 hypothetical protein [Candidatus Omnitrophota bacterium]HQB12319.1 hypothetical protein [Candidatus Omnitrophota bacterium]
MKRFVFFLALTLLLGTPLTSSAATESDPVHVKAEIDKAFLTIGDLVTYTITIEHHPDTQILSSIPAPNEEFLEIKKSEDIYKKRKKAVLEGRKFTLAAYRVGEYVLDPVVIRYRKMGESEEKTVQTNKLYLYVRSVAGDIPQEDIRDVKDVVPFVFRYSKIIIFVLVLAGLALGYWAYRQLRKRFLSTESSSAPRLTPEEEALQNLVELFESDLLRKGLVKIYYLRLSEILKVYFERRYQILAVESTTAEILRDLPGRSFTPEMVEKIKYVLEMADLAKFAKGIPTATEVLQINRDAEAIVRFYVPPPPVPEEVPQ